MSNSLAVTFQFENLPLRTINKDGEPWFIAQDVCQALRIVNTSDAIRRLDDDEKSTIGLTDSQAGRGAQSILIVSESGLFTLILRCRDAVNKGTLPYRFRKWVTSEVLPAIRKTGRYDTNQESLINSHSYRHESHLALNTFYDACKAELDKAGIKVPNLPRPDNKVLDGLISGMLMSSRFLLSFDYKLKATISQVPMNACVVDTKNKINMSTIMKEFVPIELIPNLMEIGIQRLSKQFK